jgi:hypothetical protein
LPFFGVQEPISKTPRGELELCRSADFGLYFALSKAAYDTARNSNFFEVRVLNIASKLLMTNTDMTVVGEFVAGWRDQSKG